MNKCCRACAFALTLPLLNGCTAAIIAAQVVPTVVGGIAIAGAQPRSPFRMGGGATAPDTDPDLSALNARIRQAECGDAPSQYWLASALQNGFNTTPNDIEIYKWYRLAELGKFVPASAQLAALAATMSTSEIAQARARAQVWQASNQGCAASG